MNIPPDRSFCVSDAAKILGIAPKTLFHWLHEHGWIFKRQRGGEWIAYQAHLQSRELVMVVVKFAGKANELRHALQVRITSVGLNHLRQLINAT